MEVPLYEVNEQLEVLFLVLMLLSRGSLVQDLHFKVLGLVTVLEVRLVVGVGLVSLFHLI